MEKVELRINGHSLGKKVVNKYDIPAWRVKYVPGQVEARGWKEGKVYKIKVETTGEPASLALVSETGPSLQDANDISVITVKVLDKKGRVVPTANNLIYFTIRHGRILGVGNGHPSSQEPDVFPQGVPAYRHAFNGYAQVIVAGDGSGRPVELIAQSEGLKEALIQIHSSK